MTVDRLELPVRDAKVEVVGGFAVPVVEVNDLAVVDVFLGELVARVRDVLGRDEPALRRHVHDVVNNVRGGSVCVFGEQFFRSDRLELLLDDVHARRIREEPLGVKDS